MEQKHQTYSRPSACFDGDGTLVVRASAASGCRRALWYAASEHQPTNPPTDEALTVMETGTRPGRGGASGHGAGWLGHPSPPTPWNHRRCRCR